MHALPNENDKWYKKNGKRSFYPFKRLFSKGIILPFPGKLKYHLLIIALYITYEVIVNISNNVYYGWQIYVPFYVAFFTLFYLFTHVLYPIAWCQQKNKISVFLIILTCFSLSIFSTIFINHTFRYIQTGELSLRTHHQTFVNAIWRAISLLTLSGVYWFYFNTLALKTNEIIMLKKEQEMERNFNKMKIAYENARINPHFLFNTLQFIYKEVELVSPKAEKAIFNLSEIMRYLLAPFPDKGKVSLKEEIEITDIFIEMARQRFGTTFYLNYSKMTNDLPNNIKIPQHTILNIAENLIKHGVLTDAQKPAILSIKCNHNLLEILVANHKSIPTKTMESGIGLQNLITRLDFYYEGRYELDIHNENVFYDLKLKIAL